MIILKELKKKYFLEFFFLNFLKMGISGPGPGQAAGMVLKPKLLQNPKKLIFSKIGVNFKGHPCRI